MSSPKILSAHITIQDPLEYDSQQVIDHCVKVMGGDGWAGRAIKSIKDGKFTGLWIVLLAREREA